MRSRAVVLLSGGMDSAVCLHVAHAEGFAIHAISFRYGQRHALEIDAARRVSGSLPGVEWMLVDVPLDRFGGSALTDRDLRPSREGGGREIPLTYVPARNTVFLSLALAWAETLAARDLFIGVNAVDYSGYPDCRPEYIAAFEVLANLATRAGVTGSSFRIRAPLQHLSKAQIILKGRELGVDFALTRSCYDPDLQDRACGVCDACRLRLAGFAAAGLVDPISYVDH
ncbi:MAG: 7-cyano-7-deazaguanine synthase QueC [Magnetococcales bacterium]|nr:7-cyano-7-deazaguanine synthase QueC [Magnetococcales bacterium]